MKRTLLLLISACSIPPLDIAGKPCVDTCGDGFSCTGRICVPIGGHFCDFFVSSTTCLDFDEGLKLDAGWVVENVPGALQIDLDAGTLVSEVAQADGGTGMRGRLRYPIVPWQHAKESFDLKPALVAQASFVAVSEIQCAPPFEGAWFHYVASGNTSQFELRSGNTSQAVFLNPQPAMGAWSRITLETTFGSPPLAQVFVNGTLAASTPVVLTDCTDAGWELNLGLSPQSGDLFERAEIDNVVFDYTPR